MGTDVSLGGGKDVSGPPPRATAESNAPGALEGSGIAAARDSFEASRAGGTACGGVTAFEGAGIDACAPGLLELAGSSVSMAAPNSPEAGLLSGQKRSGSARVSSSLWSIGSCEG